MAYVTAMQYWWCTHCLHLDNRLTDSLEANWMASWINDNYGINCYHLPVTTVVAGGLEALDKAWEESNYQWGPCLLGMMCEIKRAVVSTIDKAYFSLNVVFDKASSWWSIENEAFLDKEMWTLVWVFLPICHNSKRFLFLAILTF